MITLTPNLIKALNEQLENTMYNDTFTSDVVHELEDHLDSEVEDSHDLYELLDCRGVLHEFIDSAIDIYNHILRQWAVDNYEYIEQALEDGICAGITDFHDLIKLGQYHMYQQEMYQCVEDIFNILDVLNFELEKEEEEEAY